MKSVIFKPSFRPNPKPSPKEKRKPQPISKAKKPTGEAELFAQIWKERLHVSQINGEPLGDEAHAFMFIHVLSKAKNKYPEFKLNPENIILGTWDQHFAFDQAPRSHIENDSAWQPILKLESELKEEYKRLYGK